MLKTAQSYAKKAAGSVLSRWRIAVPEPAREPRWTEVRWDDGSLVLEAKRHRVGAKVVTSLRTGWARQELISWGKMPDTRNEGESRASWIRLVA